MYGRQSDNFLDVIFEAERRVRAGETQADVAEALRIPRSTLASWARNGKWRRKDLVAVRDAERAAEARLMAAHFTAAERKARQRDGEAMRTAIEDAQAEVAEVTPAGLANVATAEADTPARKVALAMANDLLMQGRLEDADRAVRLAVRFAEAEQAADERESAHWRSERERLTRWWAERRADFNMLHEATHYALRQMEERRKLEDSRSVRDRCPACGRHMDFWPEEMGASGDDGEAWQPESDESDESGESGESADSAKVRMSEFPDSAGDEFP